MGIDYQGMAERLRNQIMNGEIKFRNQDQWRYDLARMSEAEAARQRQWQAQQNQENRDWQTRLSEQSSRDNRQSSIAGILGNILGPLAGAGGTALFSGGGSGSGASASSGLFGGIGDLASGLFGGGNGTGAVADSGYTLGVDAPDFAGVVGGGSAGGGLGSFFAPAAVAAAGGYTGYQQAKGLADAFKGGDLSAQSQAALALPTFGASLAYNPVKNAFGGGVSQDSKDRSAARDTMSSMGMDGAQYKGADYNVDMSNPNSAEVISALNPLGEIVAYRASGGGKDKEQQARIREQTTGYMVNDAMTPGGTGDSSNLRKFYESAGIDKGAATQLVNQMLAGGVIDQATAATYLNSINNLFA